MKTIKGPGIFLAQFAGDQAPYNSLNDICRWAASLGFKGVQIPTWDSRLFNLKLAAESSAYCDELRGTLASHGLALTELSTHLQGQLVAVHPAYDSLFDSFAPTSVHGAPAARTAWAVDQLHLAAKASRNLGLDRHATFSGALAWPYLYPWPQRPSGLVEAAFQELADRWLPILNVFDENGVDLCYEIHPGEDLHDGASFEMFLDGVKGHYRCNLLYDPSHFILQQLNYLEYIDLYHDRIKMFHVKDAEFRPSGRQGVYGGFQSWINRAGRFRSLGDGQVDFGAIFSKLTQYGFDGWAVMEWECCIKSSEQGAREGAPFIQRHIIETAGKAFDDFAGASTAQKMIDSLLGLKKDKEMAAKLGRKLRLGIVGGGPGAFIGEVHRTASRIDNHFELVAGVLSANPEKSRSYAAELGIRRVYSSFAEMAAVEAKHPERIDVVAIVTPNDTHYSIAKAFLAAGIHVMCEKPMTTSLDEAIRLAAEVDRSGLIFALNHSYSGYPIVRQMRNIVQSGGIGKVRMMHLEYVQGWLATALEKSGSKQAEWRTDPTRSGPAGCLGDIATHAYHLAYFVSGLKSEAISAELTTFVPGRLLDDNVQALIRYEGGAKASLWSSQIAIGNENNLNIRIYGETGALEWRQENPNYARYTPLNQLPQVLSRGGGALNAAASRLPAGHPEGYFEAFATLYSDLAELIGARIEERQPNPNATLLPTCTDGVEGLRFIEAALQSSKNNSAWESLH